VSRNNPNPSSNQNTSLEWLESIKPCIVDPKDPKSSRIYPSGRRIEVVFVLEAANYLLLRTEGPGYINEAGLPESKIDVPVIQPQKLQAVVRRRMLEILRDYRDSGANLKPYIEEALKLGFTKAKEHMEKVWNCTIQPPLATSGEKATDLGMDGYCPACTLFGVALVSTQWSKLSGNVSLGIKSRVRFDPAFAIAREVTPETHNKVTDGLISSTGGALFTEVHVEPGTLFIGRLVLVNVTEAELLATLYSLITTEEIGGRSSVFGTIRTELVGIRCGKYSATTALELADEMAQKFKTGATLSQLVKELRGELQKRNVGFKDISNKDVLERVGEINKENKVLKELWDSSISFIAEIAKHVETLTGQSSGKKTRGEEKKEE